MVTKSCTKILDFSTRFSCQHFAVEDFVTLFMGKKYCRWGNVVFGHGFDKLVYALLCGGDTKFKMATYFFSTRGWDLQEKEKAELLLYSTTNSEAQTPTYVYEEVLPSFTHCRWMNTNTARQEYATLIKFCTLCSELHTGFALMFCRLLAAKIPQILNSLHWGWGVHRSERFLFRMTISGPTVVVPELIWKQ